MRRERGEEGERGGGREGGREREIFIINARCLFFWTKAIQHLIPGGGGGREDGGQMQVFVFLYKSIQHLTHPMRSDMISWCDDY